MTVTIAFYNVDEFLDFLLKNPRLIYTDVGGKYNILVVGETVTFFKKVHTADIAETEDVQEAA